MGSPAEEIFDAVIRAARAIALEDAKARAERKARRLQARRARYALRKAAGTLPIRVKPAEAETDDYETPTSCYCDSCRMPPCGWCEGFYGNGSEALDA